MRRIISERPAGGIRMRRAVYTWQEGERLSEMHEDLVLHLVSGHHPVRARCVGDDGTDYPVGRLNLSPPRQQLFAVATSTEHDMRATTFLIDADFLDRGLKNCGSPIRASDIEMEPNLQNSAIEASLLRMIQEFEGRSFASGQVIDILTQMLIIDLARHLSDQRETNEAHPGGLRPAQLRHIYDFIEGYEVGLPSPAEVAAECGISPTHLRRLFKRTTRQSLQDYIKGVRTDRAKALLSETDLPLKVVSYRLGFNHCSAFTYAFQQATGETPGQFRRRREVCLNEALAVDAMAFHAAA